MPDVYPANQPPLFFSTRENDVRLAASFDRLSQPDYEPAAVMAETVVDSWPGDLAGRLLLSLSRFSRAGFPALEHATALFEGMLDVVNSDGYFGALLGEVVDEQQVACHGWVVSGLLQYSAVSGDARASVAAFRIVDALLLPALGRLDLYPFDRDPSAEVGQPSGRADVILNGWRLSTDIWCVFLALNALVPCFQQSGRPDIGAAIVSLREVLDRVDVVQKRAQLHATLAAARCLADFAEAGLAASGGAAPSRPAEATGPGSGIRTGGLGAGEFLAAKATALRLYDAYAAHGRTLNYATFNWFGRPDSWTEPCAIVDSLALAYTLWRLTQDDRYLDDARRIEYNALDTAERPNGSFGLDSVLTPEHPELRAIHPDARWCCTMRGAIGLLEARENSVAFTTFVDNVAPGGELEVVGFHSGTIVVTITVAADRSAVDADGGRPREWTLRETTAYPAAGRVRFDVIHAPHGAEPLTLTLRHPGGTQSLTLPARAAAAGEAVIPLQMTEEPVGGGLVSVFRGPVLQRFNSATQDAHEQPELRVKLDTPPKWGKPNVLGIETI